MLLQPQPLAEHFAHGVPDRVVVVAGHRLDFGPGDAQAGLQGVGGVQQLAATARWRPGGLAPHQDECNRATSDPPRR